MDYVPETSSSRSQRANAQRTNLVVEDERLMLRLLEKFLSRQGYQVLLAADGEQAIDGYCRHKTEIDVVLFMAGHQYTFFSSSTVREISSLGGDVSWLVPPHVVVALQRAYKQTRG